MNKVTPTTGIHEDRVWYRRAEPQEDLTGRETYTAPGWPTYVKMPPEEVELHLIDVALKPEPAAEDPWAGWWVKNEASKFIKKWAGG
jgi:hypothetical protein